MFTHKTPSEPTRPYFECIKQQLLVLNDIVSILVCVHTSIMYTYLRFFTGVQGRQA